MIRSVQVEAASSALQHSTVRRGSVKDAEAAHRLKALLRVDSNASDTSESDSLASSPAASPTMFITRPVMRHQHTLEMDGTGADEHQHLMLHHHRTSSTSTASRSRSSSFSRPSRSRLALSFQHSRTFLLTSWIQKHNRLLQAGLLAIAVLWFVVVNTWLFYRPTLLSTPKPLRHSEFPLHRNPSPAELLLHGQHVFRHPGKAYREWRGKGGRRTRMQTLRTTADAQTRYSDVPLDHRPPSIVCPWNQTASTANDLSDCLLEAYFSKERKEFPTLLRTLSERSSNSTCDSLIRLHVDANHTTPNISPGRMLRSYLSFLSFAALLDAEIAPAANPTHPWWTWHRGDQFSELTDGLEHAATAASTQNVEQYDLGRLLAMNQWEMDVGSGSNDWPSRTRQQHLVWTDRIGLAQGQEAAGALVPANDTESSHQMTALLSEIQRTLMSSSDASPPSDEPPTSTAYAERWEQRRSRIRSGVTDAALPPPAPSRNSDAPSLSLRFQQSSWDAPLEDPRIGLVLETRLWLRHTKMMLALGAQYDRLTPIMMPKDVEEARLAKEQNYFLSLEQIEETAKRELQRSGYAASLGRGFDPGLANPYHACDTPVAPAPTAPQASLPEVDAAEFLSSWDSVFKKYYSPMIHVALVYKQSRKLRKISTAVTPEEPADQLEEDGLAVITRGKKRIRHGAKTVDKLVGRAKRGFAGARRRNEDLDVPRRRRLSGIEKLQSSRAHARQAKGISDGGASKPGSSAPPAASTSQHMNIGVPIAYVDEVITFNSSLSLFLALHSTLPRALQDQIVVTVYVDAVGVTREDLEPLIIRLQRHNIQARLMVNTPLAVQVQSIAMSDVQFYFCEESRRVGGESAPPVDLRDEDRMDLGTCGLSAFLRSEPLKFFVDSPGLEEVYPFVRNVVRMEKKNDKEEEGRERVKQAKMHEGDLGLLHPLSAEESASLLAAHFPAEQRRKIEMVRLEDVKQTLELKLAEGQSAEEVFVTKVRRVYERKQRRLRSGGVPHFLENYSADVPIESILIPTHLQPIAKPEAVEEKPADKEL